MYSSQQQFSLTATGNSHAIWDHTVLPTYLPPGRGEIPAFIPSRSSSTRFSDPKGMQGRVDLCYVKTDGLGIEHAICESQIQRPTAAPRRKKYVTFALLSEKDRVGHQVTYT